MSGTGKNLKERRSQIAYRLVVVLPSKDCEDYYGPLQEQFIVFRVKHSKNAQAQAFADSVQREIDIWKECGDSYGYVFHLGRTI